MSSILTEFAETPANVALGASPIVLPPSNVSTGAPGGRRPPVVHGFQAFTDKALTTAAAWKDGKGYTFAGIAGTTLYFACKLDTPFQGSDLIVVDSGTAADSSALVVSSVRSNSKRSENTIAEPGVPVSAFALGTVRRFGMQMQPTPQNSSIVVEITNTAAVAQYCNLAIAGDCFGCQGPDVDANLIKSPPVVLGFQAFKDKALTQPATAAQGGYTFANSGTLYFACKLDVDFRGFDLLAFGDSSASLADIVVGSVRSNGKRRENMIAEPGVPASIFAGGVFRRFGLNMWPTEQNSTLIIEATNLGAGTTPSATFAVAGTCYDCNVCTTGSCG